MATLRASVIGDISQAGISADPASLYLCTNENTFRDCILAKKPAFLLDEQILADEYKKINTWAYETVFSLLKRFENEPEKADYLDAAFIDVKALVVHTLKSLRAIHRVRKTNYFDELSFGTSPKNALFAQACRIYFEGNGLSVLGVPPMPLDATSAKTNFLLKPLLRRFLSTGPERIDSWEKSGKHFIFVSGALMHLSELVRSLRQAGREVMYAENDFNLEKALFCRANGATFLVLPRRAKGPSPFTEKDIFFKGGEADFEGEDYARVLDRVFHESLRAGRIGHAYDVPTVKQILSSPVLDRVLLDEDFSTRRLFFVTARRLGKKCFVVSHGVPALFLENRKELAGRYSTAPTFVQSEFEKTAYESIYCASSKIRVTGLPRYDRLVSMPKKTGVPTGKKTVLYCGSIFGDYDFNDFFTVMGCKDFLGDFTKRYLYDLLDYLPRNPNLTLAIKPHYKEEAQWRRCLNAHAPGGRWKLYSHKEDTQILETTADVIVTPESSVICEGLMLKKPVIVLNYGTQPLSTDFFEEKEVIWHAKDKKSLHEGLRKCLDDAVYLERLSRNNERAFPFFAGAFDGKNIHRVAQAVLLESL